MRKALIALLSTTAIGVGVIAGAAPAAANPALLLPWAIAAASGGLTVGVAASTASQPSQTTAVTPAPTPGRGPVNPAYGADYPPVVYTSPDEYLGAPPPDEGICQLTEQRTPDGWRTVRICD
jgi:hypothetical protein